ncbi:MAG: hypothetical protein AAF583_02730 [Pseudomonadota bacterium]
MTELKISETMAAALEDLERIELEFTIEEPEAKAKKIEGRLVAFMREKGDKPH